MSARAWGGCGRRGQVPSSSHSPWGVSGLQWSPAVLGSDLGLCLQSCNLVKCGLRPSLKRLQKPLKVSAGLWSWRVCRQNKAPEGESTRSRPGPPFLLFKALSSSLPLFSPSLSRGTHTHCLSSRNLKGTQKTRRMRGKGLGFCCEQGKEFFFSPR